MSEYGEPEASSKDYGGMSVDETGGASYADDDGGASVDDSPVATYDDSPTATYDTTEQMTPDDPDYGAPAFPLPEEHGYGHPGGRAGGEGGAPSYYEETGIGGAPPGDMGAPVEQDPVTFVSCMGSLGMPVPSTFYSGVTTVTGTVGALSKGLQTFGALSEQATLAEVAAAVGLTEVLAIAGGLTALAYISACQFCLSEMGVFDAV